MHGSQIKSFSHWFLNNFGKKAADKAVKTAGEEYEKQLKEYEAAVKKQQEEERNIDEEIAKLEAAKKAKESVQVLEKVLRAIYSREIEPSGS